MPDASDDQPDAPGFGQEGSTHRQRPASLGLAGAFTLLPGRRMHAVLFGAEAGWPPSIAAIAAVLATVALLWTRLARTPPASA